MPSAPAKRTSTSSSSRPSAGSPTLTTSSYGYYQMPAPTTQQGIPSNYNPAAIQSWMNGVQQSNQPRPQVNMQDPAVQAYMQAKMGLYQQAAAHKSSKSSGKSSGKKSK